jgi:pyruvate dehydrogenase E1 component alpha subunit
MSDRNFDSNSRLEKELLVDLYRTMLLIRRAEEKIAELYPKQEMRCPVHLCVGQEAVGVGVCKNLTSGDMVFSNHRSHGHYIAKGGNLKAMFAEIYGKATGCTKGRGGSMHLIDRRVNFIASTSIVGGTIPVAAGAAFALKARKKDNISVAFFGDAAIEEGVFHETLNFSSLKKLPILFVCENNLYAVQTPISARQPERQILKLVESHGLAAYQADGNDVVKVFEITRKAIDHIKSGKGPAFIEFLTYRWREHCGPNFDHEKGYRTEAEVFSWQKKCPLERLRVGLIREKILNEKQLEELQQEIDHEVEQAVAFAKESPFPAKTDLYEYLYSD